MALTYFPRNIYFDGNIGLTEVFLLYITGNQQLKLTLPTIASLIFVGTGKYFQFSTPTTDYVVWFNVDGGSTAPAVPGTLIEIAVLSTDTQETLIQAVVTALDALPDVTSAVVNGELLVINDDLGVPLNPPTDVDSGVVIEIITEGTAESSEYYVEPQYLDDYDITALESMQNQVGLTFPMPLSIVQDQNLMFHPVTLQSAFETVRGKLREVLEKPPITFFHRTSSATYWNGTEDVRLIDDTPV